MKNLLVLVCTFLALTANAEVSKWCKDTSFILENAIVSGFDTTTYEEELEILLDASHFVLESTPKKNFFYFYTTLASAVDGTQVYESTEHQVLFLRRHLRDAISDLDKFHYRLTRKLCLWCYGNHKEYVQDVLSRGLTEGERAKNDETELAVLDRVSTLAIDLIEDSTFSRKYECAKKSLTFALQTRDVMSKRRNVLSAYRLMRNNGCN
ncbi:MULTISPECIES: hypothetical protein [Halobacteriovorax]|uniref:Uncharacterized protein n=1 Tax=Halobacteriovorax vibrionivorans TaxID=2152716 RepID=A0ABY0IIX1_9BACT|nr:MULTISPECIES: hypothetical protein [Halobacteriovorax]RZF21277.1 hypothetical protein DAY19_06225 [Halobacteriovorax vibrionivorans]TGD47965.1 hypothetical protein EP118_05905 [Halobacteriovorax sp. Y22]